MSIISEIVKKAVKDGLSAGEIKGLLKGVGKKGKRLVTKGKKARKKDLKTKAIHYQRANEIQGVTLEEKNMLVRPGATLSDKAYTKHLDMQEQAKIRNSRAKYKTKRDKTGKR